MNAEEQLNQVIEGYNKRTRKKLDEDDVDDIAEVSMELDDFDRRLREEKKRGKEGMKTGLMH